MRLGREVQQHGASPCISRGNRLLALIPVCHVTDTTSNTHKRETRITGKSTYSDPVYVSAAACLASDYRSPRHRHGLTSHRFSGQLLPCQNCIKFRSEIAIDAASSRIIVPTKTPANMGPQRIYQRSNNAFRGCGFPIADSPEVVLCHFPDTAARGHLTTSAKPQTYGAAHIASAAASVVQIPNSILCFVIVVSVACGCGVSASCLCGLCMSIASRTRRQSSASSCRAMQEFAVQFSGGFVRRFGRSKLPSNSPLLSAVACVQPLIKSLAKATLRHVPSRSSWTSSPSAHNRVAA
jgi:hypothetical protein